MKTLLSRGLRYENEKLWVLDQTRLPEEEFWICVESITHMISVIQNLSVRGAPLIGTAAALSLAQAARQRMPMAELKEQAQALRAARPTAVNLMAAVDQVVFENKDLSHDSIILEAERVFEQDVETSLAMSKRGAEVICDGETILTHCNTGGLATAGMGTALGAIAWAWQQGKKIKVFVDETRPLLQGARLTTWELEKMKIPFELICDNMAGFLMKQKKVSRVFVGADRIAKNGDVANKIGTYSLAVLCKHHDVPFYVVAPRSTVDMQCVSGENIPIEQRSSSEVIGARGLKTSKTYNPAFDVTPRALITQIFLNDGTM